MFRRPTARQCRYIEYIYLMALNICNPGIFIKNFCICIFVSMFWAFDSVLRVFIRMFRYLNLRAVVDVVEVCGNVWLVAMERCCVWSLSRRTRALFWKSFCLLHQIFCKRNIRFPWEIYYSKAWNLPFKMPKFKDKRCDNPQYMKANIETMLKNMLKIFK